MQDMEFTVESGKLWLLQTRDGKRTAQAAVRIAVDLADDGLISRAEAVGRITPEQIESFLHPRFDPAASADGQHDRDRAQRLARRRHRRRSLSIPISPSSGRRRAATSSSSGPRRSPTTSTACSRPQGILTSSGGRTSHAALVARQFGRPAVVGASDLDIDLAPRTVAVGDRQSSGR